MSDEIAQRYDVVEEKLGSWSVYRVRRGNWRDLMRSSLTKDEAQAFADELEEKRR